MFLLETAYGPKKYISQAPSGWSKTGSETWHSACNVTFLEACGEARGHVLEAVHIFPVPQESVDQFQTHPELSWYVCYWNGLSPCKSVQNERLICLNCVDVGSTGVSAVLFNFEQQ